MKTDKKVAVTYKGVTYTDAHNADMDVDDPVMVARREAAADTSDAPITITLPMSIIRTLIPPITEHMYHGAVGLKMLRDQLNEFEGVISDADRAIVDETLAKDGEVSGLIRWALAQIGKQASAQLGENEPFFGVDLPTVIAAVPELLEHIPILSDAQVATLVSPAHSAALLEAQTERLRAKQVKAGDAVADELKKFAIDTDTSGKTLN